MLLSGTAAVLFFLLACFILLSNITPEFRSFIRDAAIEPLPCALLSIVNSTVHLTNSMFAGYRVFRKEDWERIQEEREHTTGE